MNGLFFGPRPSISLQGTPRALSSSVTAPSGGFCSGGALGSGARLSSEIVGRP